MGRNSHAWWKQPPQQQPTGQKAPTMQDKMESFNAWWHVNNNSTDFRKIFKNKHVLVNVVEIDSPGGPLKLAVKVVSCSRGGVNEQFDNEVKAAHFHYENPSLVPVVAYKQDAAGNTLLISLYGGKSLQDLLDSADFQNSSLEERVELIVKLMPQMVTQMVVLNACGEVHADLKPDNILWDGCELKLLDWGAWCRMFLHSGIFTYGYTDDPVLGTRDNATGKLLAYTPGAVEGFSQSAADVAAAAKTFVRLLFGGRQPAALDANTYADAAGNLDAAGRDKLMAFWAQVCDAFSAGRPTGVPELDALVAELQHVKNGPELLSLLQRMLVVDPANRITVTQLAQEPLIADKVLEQLAALQQKRPAHCQQREDLEQLMRQLVPDAADMEVVSWQSCYAHDIAGHLSRLHGSLETHLLKAKVAALEKANDLMQQQQARLQRCNQTLWQRAKAAATEQARTEAELAAAQEREAQAVDAAAAATAETAAVWAQAVQCKQLLQQQNQHLQQQLQQAQAAAAAAGAQWRQEKGHLQACVSQLTQQLQEAQQAAATAVAAAQPAEQLAVAQAADSQPLPEPLQEMAEQQEEEAVACGKQASEPADDELQMPPLRPINIVRNSNTSSSSSSSEGFEPDTPERGSSAGLAVVSLSGSSSNSDDGFRSSNCNNDNDSSSDDSSNNGTGGMSCAQAVQQASEESAPRCRVSRRHLMGLAAASVAGLVCAFSRSRRC